MLDIHGIMTLKFILTGKEAPGRGIYRDIYN